MSVCGNVCNVCMGVLQRPEEGIESPEAEVTGCLNRTWILWEDKYAFLTTRPSLQPQNYICLLTNQPRKLYKMKKENGKVEESEYVLSGKPREETFRGRGGASSRPGLS